MNSKIMVEGIAEEEANFDPKCAGIITWCHTFSPSKMWIHGGREHGFIGRRLRMNRKVVVGYWEDQDVPEKIGNWMRSAVGVSVSRSLSVVRFGDNMRQVAVTEGDNVEAEIKLGWSVNTHVVGDLVAQMEQISENVIFKRI